MLLFIFRPRYPSLHWRPSTAADLLNSKLVCIRQVEVKERKNFYRDKIVESLNNIKGRESMALFPKSATCESCRSFAKVCCANVGRNGYENPKCGGCCSHTHTRDEGKAKPVKRK
jgi:hypothetical protein